MNYPAAAVDLVKIQFDNIRVSPPESYNIYSYFLVSMLVGVPNLDKDEFENLIDNSSSDRSVYTSPNVFLWLIDVVLVDYWLRFSWDDRDILRVYLGVSRYGGYQWQGLEEASHGFFGVSVKDLSLPEMAVLVVNLKAPSGFDPLCDREGVEEMVMGLLASYKDVFPDAKFDAGQMFARLQRRECNWDRN